MSEVKIQNENFYYFREHYNGILKNFLSKQSASENNLNEGYELGRKAIAEHFGILSITAIHHDCLIDYLEKLETDEHLLIAEKANTFFEEVLVPFQMVANDFREAITLLNKRSVEFAVRIRSLQESLNEKEALLKEIYHRVKNNLQVISSLLKLQSKTMQDPSIQKIFIECAMRVQSMALVHEILYQSENLAKISIKKYINNLSKYLYEIYNTNPSRVKLVEEIDDILLKIDTAIPCGLIMNELVSNSFKHAFPNNQSGIIKITFKKQADHILLTIEDNGVGFSPAMTIENSTTLGLRLVHNLTKQLNGEIILNRDQGTHVTLTFLNDK